MSVGCCFPFFFRERRKSVQNPMIKLVSGHESMVAKGYRCDGTSKKPHVMPRVMAKKEEEKTGHKQINPTNFMEY
jgi:hypothetical protein